MRRMGLASVGLAALFLTLGVGTAWAKKENLSQAEIKLLKSILPHMKYVEVGVAGKPTIQFSDVNVQVVNGLGKTASINGTGNVVIGYDENPGTLRGKPGEQVGSHDLILGEEQAFTSYGGIDAGLFNTISGEWASVSGGGFNTASGRLSSVSGGGEGAAEAEYSSTFGGFRTKATASYQALPSCAAPGKSGELC